MNPVNAILGKNKIHTYTIIDNENVSSFNDNSLNQILSINNENLNTFNDNVLNQIL